MPAGVVSISVDATGGHGGDSAPIPGSTLVGAGGNPGRVRARISVTPGSVLIVRVGATGQAGVVGSTAAGGFNGGGAARETTAAVAAAPAACMMAPARS